MEDWERVLQGRHNPDDSHRAAGFAALTVGELNQPSERALARPQLLRERVIDDRDRL